jgi:integrase
MSEMLDSLAFKQQCVPHGNEIGSRTSQSAPSSAQAARPEQAGDADGGRRARKVKRRSALTDSEIRAMTNRIRRLSRHSAADLALFYLLLNTGAKPLELARLRVKDVVAPNGSIRSEANLPSKCAINGVARPLFFKSTVANEAIAQYLHHRVEMGHGLGDRSKYVGLDPATALLFDHHGHPYEIVAPSGANGKRHLCRGILEACRRIFRLCGVPGLCAAAVRRTLAQRLYERGASIEQIGQAMGLKDRKAVRDLLDVRQVELPELFEQIVSSADVALMR